MVYKAEIVGFVALGLFIALLIGVCVYRFIKRQREETGENAIKAVSGGPAQVATPQIVVTTPVSPTPALPPAQYDQMHPR